MTTFLFGIALTAAAILLVIAVREKNDVRSRFLRWPGAEMLGPVLILGVFVFGIACVISGWPNF
jgi:hypothetical protein